MVQAEVACFACIPVVFLLLPSTMIVALDAPLGSRLRSVHSTTEGLLSKEILWKVKLAGLAPAVSDELNPAIPFKVTVVTRFSMLFISVKFTRQNNNIMSELVLLHLNVIFPPAGTTYPPGVDRASADKLTVWKKV